MNRVLYPTAFWVGLAAVCWVGAGYLGSNPLALAITVLIGAFYLMGAVELHRYRQATATLDQALATIPAGLASLGEWLARVPASLQNPVRLRVEGDRVGLPGPAITPYLVGLLVLLGMLGTFLGMVVTLKGAVIALESTTDLQAVRDSLAAPVKGLGLAFGTSVAGVAASAILGLLSALCRRERQQAGQALDSRIASELRVFSLAHQREESFRTLQLQTRLMPELVDRLQAMMTQMERQQQASAEQLLASQERFFGNAQTAYSGLAASVDRSLQQALTESARLAGEAIQPVVQTTMAGIARETAALHEKVADAVQAQLDGVSARFGSTVDAAARAWTAAQERNEHSSERLIQGLDQTLDRFGDTFEQRSAALLATVDSTHRALQQDMAATTAAAAREAGLLHQHAADTVKTQLDGVADRLATAVAKVSTTWSESLDEQRRAGQALSAAMQASWSGLSGTFEQHAASLLATLDQAHGQLRADLASGEQQRLAAWTDSLEAMAAQLQSSWQQTGATTLAQQERLCSTLEQTAHDINARAEAHARDTMAEVAQLMQAASQAPRAAAEVMGELRQRLSDSMARDNQMLDERNRIMSTLGSLLETVQQASTEQRGAIDALVASSASLLERAGAQFSERIAAESAAMGSVATQITGGAAEVASLGEAFGFGVQLFSESNEKLVAQLQRIEASLSQSIARSDEQLAYYVAQAREIVDLSIGSQKQIVEDLQQLSIRQGAPVAASVTAPLTAEA